MINYIKKSVTVLTLLTGSIVTCGMLGPQAANAEEGGDPFIPDTPLFNEDNWYRDLRVGHWISGGSSIQEIEQVLRRISGSKGPRRVDEWADTQLAYGPGHWVYEWSEAARMQEDMAHRAVGAGRLQEAKGRYLRAANLYGIAKYPHLNSAEDDAAYKAQLRAYEEAGRYFNRPLEKIEILLDGVAINGYLHMPAGSSKSTPVPVVLISGGIDVFKAEFHLLAEELNKLGIAAFTHDMKSTGESTYQFLEKDYYRHHLAYAAALAARPDIDGNRIAVYGQSFGGNPVAKLAVDHDDKFSAAIVSCAPINLPLIAFQPEQLPVVLEPMTLDILESRFRVEDCDSSPQGQASCTAILDNLQTFALATELSKGTIDIPLLIPAPIDDPFMPQPDIDLLYSAARSTVERLPDGLGIHCTRERSKYWPQVAQWIANNI